MEIVCILVIIVGAIDCFFGYRLFKIVNAIKGFVAGGIIGACLGGLLFRNEIGLFIGFLAGGVLGALLANAIVFLFVFIESFLIGAALGGVLAFWIREYESTILFAVIAGLLLAVISCGLYKFAVIFNTAFQGAFSCDAAIGYISNFTLGVTVAVILFVLGIVVQQWFLRTTMQITDLPAITMIMLVLTGISGLLIRKVV